jgi:hypothetical protein
MHGDDGVIDLPSSPFAQRELNDRRAVGIDRSAGRACYRLLCADRAGDRAFWLHGKLAIRPNGQIIGGHAHVEALKRLGREERGVILEIQEDGENALSLGFTPNELSRILEEPGALEVREIETGPVDDEFWISVRGPLAQQANALKAVEQAMKPFAGVDCGAGDDQCWMMSARQMARVTERWRGKFEDLAGERAIAFRIIRVVASASIAKSMYARASSK